MPDNHEHALFGTGLLGDALAPKRTGNLAERFIIPPFSVLSAREGFWQDRKRAWIALGIKSELGRGCDDIQTNAVAVGTPGGMVNAMVRKMESAEKAAPGGSKMPAIDYTNRERGNSTGKAVKGTAAQAPVVAAPRKPVAPVAATLPTAPVTAPSARPAPAQKAVTISLPRRGYAQPTAPVTAAPTTGSKIPYEDPFLRSIQPKLIAAAGQPLRFDEDTWWDDPPRSAVGVDVECFVNFFCICFQRFADGKRLVFERSRRRDIDLDALHRVLNGNVLVSFNGQTYDLPMIYLAVTGKDTVDLKQASDRIVFGKDIKPWTVERELGIRVPKLNHIDLMEASPAVRQSLKMIHGRLHGRYLVDLPYEHDAMLTPDEMNVTTLYCFNDLDATEGLYRSLREPLELRSALGKEHGLDLRSKSDSQIGEALVKKKVEQALGRRLGKPDSFPTSFGYEPPEFIKFSGEQLRGVLEQLRTAKFHLLGDKPQPPEFLKNLKIKIGDGTYSMGIGGLHSNEAHRALRSDNERFLLDVDVASQYPSIIMKLGLYPPAMGPAFLEVYRKVIDDRLAAKKRQQEIEHEIADLELQLKELKSV